MRLPTTTEVICMSARTAGRREQWSFGMDVNMCSKMNKGEWRMLCERRRNKMSRMLMTPKNDTHRRLPSSLSTSHDIRQTCSSVPSGTTFFSLIFFLSVVIVSFVKSLNIYLRFAVGAFGIVIALTVERICVV